MYVIEKNIPISSIKTKYPFRHMQVGDSFLVTDEYGMRRVRASAHSFGKENPPMKFATRTVGNGVRVWRVA